MSPKRLGSAIILTCLCLTMVHVQSAVGQAELTETFSAYGITFKYPKAMNLENKTSNTVALGSVIGRYVTTKADSKDDHTLVLAWSTKEYQSSTAFQIDSFFGTLKNSLPEGAGVEREGKIYTQQINDYNVTFEHYSAVASGKVLLVGVIGVWKIPNTVFLIALTGSEQNKVDALLNSYLRSFAYVPSAPSATEIPDWVYDILPGVATVVVLAVLYKVFRSRTRKKFETGLKQPLSSVQTEDSVKDPLRCVEIKSMIYDKSSVIAFTSDKLLVVRLGFSMDAAVGFGTNTGAFSEVHQLIAGKDEKMVMNIAKGSYAIPLISITKVILKKGKLGDKVIEISSSQGDKRFRTGEDSDRIKEAFLKHLPNRFTSEI